MTRPCSARWGGARLGEGTECTAKRNVLRRGGALRGAALQGTAGQDMARAQSALNQINTRSIPAWLGNARLGGAVQGKGTEFIFSKGGIVAKMRQQTEVTRELVAQWEAKRPALKRLNDATLDKPRGWSITKQELEAIAGGADEYASAAHWWRESLLWLRGITVEYTATIKGYRFIEVERHLTDRQRRVSKTIERKHRKEMQRLAVIRTKDMTDHQQRLRAFSMEQHARAAGAIEAAREHHRIVVTQPETLPRIAGN